MLAHRPAGCSTRRPAEAETTKEDSMFPEFGIVLGILVAAVTLGGVIFAMRAGRPRRKGGVIRDISAK
jgi:hypothetical protein